MVVISHGELVAERYAHGLTPETRLPSWSMAKSVTHALVGILVRDGQLDPEAPVGWPLWQERQDGRETITLDQMLRMKSGLTFVEDYADANNGHALQMLFGLGRHDMAAYAAALPLAHPPGTHWSYSSGTTNIISGLIRRTIGARTSEDYRAFINDTLLHPLGIVDAVPEFDHAGTFIGSSFIQMSARDWARFGLLYLRDGMWAGTRILPAGWADAARTPTPESDGRYGAHFWLNAIRPSTGAPAISDRIPADTFLARGFGGQATLIVPSRDLVIVVMGATYDEQSTAIVDLVGDIIALFPPVAPQP